MLVDEVACRVVINVVFITDFLHQFQPLGDISFSPQFYQQFRGKYQVVGSIIEQGEEFAVFGYKETKNFVFDFTELNFIDSAGLGGVISCLKATAEENGDIRICNLSSKVRMVFEITRAHRVFDIFDDLKTAISSYQ